KVTITADEIKGYLGAPRFYPEEARKELPPGVATGMAWTEMGGEVLFIEATLLPGGSGLTLTGQLGDVMKESAQAARSYLWSHAAEFGIESEVIKQNGVHIHVPAGSIPKDVLKELEIIPASWISDVLNAALEPGPAGDSGKLYALPTPETGPDDTGERLIAREK